MKKIIYESIKGIVQQISFHQADRLGKILGDMMWVALPPRRRLAVEAISLHLDMQAMQAQKMARRNFQNIGRSFLEIFLSRKFDLRHIRKNVHIAAPHILTEVINTERPIVAVTGHLGAWELLAPMLNVYFRNRRAQIIVQENKDQEMNDLQRILRQHSEVEIVLNKQGAGKILRCLRQKGISSFLVDHNCGTRKAVFLPFMKKYAAVNKGPATMAVLSKALVWPVFLIRKENQKYVFQCEEPLDTNELNGDKTEKIKSVASFYTQCVEKMVCQYPEQWFWIHKRWKNRPPWEKNKTMPRDQSTAIS